MNKQFLMGTGLPVMTLHPQPHPRAEGAGKIPISLSFLGGDLITHFTSSCLRVWLLIFIHLGTGCDLSNGPGAARGHFCIFHLQHTTVIKPGHQCLSGRSLHTHMAPQLLWLPPGGHNLRSPDSDDKGACIKITAEKYF